MPNARQCATCKSVSATYSVSATSSGHTKFFVSATFHATICTMVWFVDPKYRCDLVDLQQKESLLFLHSLTSSIAPPASPAASPQTDGAARWIRWLTHMVNITDCLVNNTSHGGLRSAATVTAVTLRNHWRPYDSSARTLSPINPLATAGFRHAHTASGCVLSLML